MQNNHWKTLEPEDTLININKIIHNLGFIENLTWNTFDIEHEVFSCNYNIVNQKHLCTQGKGTSPIYAMASAKAEFLERLQNYMLAFRPNSALCCKDEKLDSNNKVLTPYYNCTTHKPIYLLWGEYTNDTTGMASGNSVEEALVHAMCEIIERYLYYLFSENKLQIHCPLQLPKKFDLLFKNNNIKYKLYDCSLFNIPATYLELYVNDGCIIMIDCAPTQQIAIERCITETLQGYDVDVLINEKKYHPIVKENLSQLYSDNKILYYGLILTNNYIIPQHLLDDTHRRIDYCANIVEFSSYKDFIKNFTKNISTIFGDVYIRVNDFLGFPAVHVTMERSWLPNNFNYHGLAPICTFELIDAYIRNMNLLTQNTAVDAVVVLNKDLQKMKKRQDDTENFSYLQLKEFSKNYEMNMSIIDDIFYKKGKI